MPHLTAPDGTKIAYEDHLPPRTPDRTILLLHGLAGDRAEWSDLIPRLLADGHRVVAYDARAHGASTRRPADVTRAAHVADGVALVEELGLAPVTLVGQSLGGHTALLVAAAQPHLVRSLILIEAGPAGRNPELPSLIASWLADWHPADRAVMVACVAELATDDHWREWSAVRCPTLLVEGANGTMGPTEPSDMLARRRPDDDVRHVVVPDAGHDVHLDRPEQLYEAIAGYLNDLNAGR
ncbi:alpha/beta fold hydrolase [Streptomyces sp. NPDC057257]|uniref:alpha/beta fold hydrolase n=1 Tax=Streptomyces sp. NPDC057257 TaxID=3346071 RepID=UPI003645B1D9